MGKRNTVTCRTCDKPIVFDQSKRQWIHSRSREPACAIGDYTPPVATPKQKGWL